MAAAEAKTRGGTIWDCVRCTAHTAQGVQCSRRTCKYADRCWQHARATWGVRIAPSTLPDAGDGLFATRDFAEGEVIVPYGGDMRVLDAWEEDDLAGTDYWRQVNHVNLRDARSCSIHSIRAG